MPFDSLSGDGKLPEAGIQSLIHNHPELIPMAEIEPAFMPLVLLCMELPSSAGYVDNLWITPAGGIVIGECKLFRNPQARREVVAQALDYARSIKDWSYTEFEAAIRKARKEPSFSLWSHLSEQTDHDGRVSLDEAHFVDAVERRLRLGQFMVLIIGDGIREGVQALADHLQLHAGLHTGVALVELALWRDGDRLLVVPRVPFKTVLVERGVVSIDGHGSVSIKAAKDEKTREGATPQPAAPSSLSELEFYVQLEQNRPGAAQALKAFVQSLAECGVVPEFQKSLVLRWSIDPDTDGSAGYIEPAGRVQLGDGHWAASKLGAPELGLRYLERLADAVGGMLVGLDRTTPRVAGPDGRVVDISALLQVADVWRAAISDLVSGVQEVARNRSKPD